MSDAESNGSKRQVRVDVLVINSRFQNYVSERNSITKIQITTFFLGRSPIFSHVNATLQGLATVRASNAAFILEKEFHEFTDYNTSCWYVFMCAARWFALWLDFVCILFIAIVTFSFLSLGNGELSNFSKIHSVDRFFF